VFYHTAPISAIAQSHRHIVTGGYDNKLILWNLTNQFQPESVDMVMHDHLVSHCQFRSDGLFVVSASSDCTARLWRCIENRLFLERVLTGHSDDLVMASFSSDGTKIATASMDLSIKVFDLLGTCIQSFTGHTDYLNSVQWFDNDKYLVSSADDGFVKIWSLETGEQVNTFTLGDSDADTVVIGGDNLIFAGDNTGKLSIINSTSNINYKNHDTGIKKIAISENRKKLFSASYDNTICSWNILGGALEFENKISMPDQAWAKSFCMDESRNLLHVGSFNGIFHSYDFGLNKWIPTLKAYTKGINALAFYEDQIWQVGDSGELKTGSGQCIELGSLCNTLISTPVGMFAAGHLGDIFWISDNDEDQYRSKVIYSHDSPLNCSTSILISNQILALFFGSYNGDLVIVQIDLSASDIIGFSSINIASDAIKSIASVDDRYCMAVCAKGDSILYDYDKLLTFKYPEFHSKVANSCVAIDSDLFASVSRDLCLYLWDKHSLVGRIKSPHTHSIKCVAWCEPWIITASYNGCVCFYHYFNKSWSSSIQRPTTSGISTLLVESFESCSSNIIYAGAWDGCVYPITLPQTV
tara:strand:+ start:7552 stop:9300 length:1749 start_codon:yes stop_codon:yes gene_type:complete